MGITFHLQWLINEMGFSTHQLCVIHDSFFVPTSTILPLKSVSNSDLFILALFSDIAGAILAPPHARWSKSDDRPDLGEWLSMCVGI